MARIEISGHHASNEMDMYGYGGSRGYDRKQNKFADAQTKKIFVTANPKTTVLLLSGPDKTCALCLQNEKGRRFNRKLAERIGEDTCNPCEEEMVLHNKAAIQRIENIMGKSNGEITAGDFQEWRRREDEPFGAFLRDTLSNLADLSDSY